MKRLFILANNTARTSAAEAIRSAPEGYRVEIKPPSRTLDQNALLWALLTDIAQQVKWPVDGEMTLLSEEDWKDLFTAALRRNQRMARGIEGGVVMLGSRTSRMSKAEFSDLCELIQAFGAERGVEWTQ